MTVVTADGLWAKWHDQKWGFEDDLGAVEEVKKAPAKHLLVRWWCCHTSGGAVQMGKASRKPRDERNQQLRETGGCWMGMTPESQEEQHLEGFDHIGFDTRFPTPQSPQVTQKLCQDWKRNEEKDRTRFQSWFYHWSISLQLRSLFCKTGRWPLQPSSWANTVPLAM